MQQQVDGEKLMNDFFAATEYLAAQEEVTGKVGITPRYDPEAAELAWQRTIDWFRNYLG